MSSDVADPITRLRASLAPASGSELPEHAEPGHRSRQAAVAAILRGAGDDLELLLIRRAERTGDVWSGHVALPGGRREPHDDDLIATASREVMEEIAVDLSTAGCELLGALPSLLPMNPALPPISVQPYVWHVPRGIDPRTSDEVAAVAWISLEHLRDTAHHLEHRLVTPDGIERAFPAIHVGGDVPLWGMTHRIVATLLEVLDPR
ncbi:MAG: CoA pyrophosphatase [Thermoleophilia bacterium]|nr:CoA pyrophosphatase [Thermoleophilia bacterium]